LVSDTCSPAAPFRTRPRKVSDTCSKRGATSQLRRVSDTNDPRTRREG
jgi:hypothetical protein